jgi:hypothetical protein
VRYAYSYAMRKVPDRVRAVAPQHATYWHDLGLPRYEGGPFSDRSGGLITFEADSLAAADGLAAADPFRTEDLIEDFWLHEWLA